MNVKEFIDFICPEHYRTSCSDDNIANGFCLEEDGKLLIFSIAIGVKGVLC